MNAETFTLTSPKEPRPRKRLGGWTWGPLESAKLRALSMGAGVQTTALALMACRGIVGPRPDVVIMSDTGDESSKTYHHWRWLKTEIARLSNGQVECIDVSRGERLSDRIRKRASGEAGYGKQERFVSAPFFTSNGGQGKRQCTREFKIEPLEKEQRRLMGFKPRQRIPAKSCEVWIGITTNEIVRAGAAFAPWAVNRYPLLEQRMSRSDCERWLIAEGYPVPPKSACVFCPYRSDREWRWLKENDPDAFEEACQIDELIRRSPGMKYQEYLHDSRRPLREVDLSTAEERGQGMLMVCEAGCGL